MTPKGTHIKYPADFHSQQTAIGKHVTVTSPSQRLKVTSPLLKRWQIALILGVTAKTIARWEAGTGSAPTNARLLITERIGRGIRYPADANGVSNLIEVVNDPKDATPKPSSNP